MTRRPETLSFWRGRLPHWEVADGRYFVTLHLAGAIPPCGQDRIRALSAEHERLTPRSADSLALQRKIYAEMESWLDRCEYAAHLRRPEVAQVVVDAIAFRHDRTWTVWEYVVMPSHLHLFLDAGAGGLKSGLEQFKRWTGHRAAELIDLPGGQFWQDEWFDHWSRSDEEDDRIAEYIRRNPVKAKLVTRYEDWPYGSWSRPRPSSVGPASRAGPTSPTVGAPGYTGSINAGGPGPPRLGGLS